MTVKDIVKYWIEEHGYDGLYSDFECGCRVDLKDFVPCDGENWIYCMPGYKQLRDDGDWIVGPEKPK